MVPTVPDPNFDVTVPVRFHEIIKTNGNGGGDLSNARIAAQIDALNVGYAGTGFTFELAENTETVQPQWWNLIGANGADVRLYRGGGKEVDMKQLLADDDPATMEVYSASLGQHLLGFAYFPSDFTEETTLELGPLPRFFDGVVIDFRSLPVVAGDTDGDQRVFPDGTYEEGDTLTHEVGHWLELFHTFQGGCTDNPAYNGGDQIADTPAEASPNFFCPEPGDDPRDTCPADPGLDPVNNFMDYSFDVCLTEFTDQQALADRRAHHADDERHDERQQREHLGDDQLRQHHPRPARFEGERHQGRALAPLAGHQHDRQDRQEERRHVRRDAHEVAQEHPIGLHQGDHRRRAGHQDHDQGDPHEQPEAGAGVAGLAQLDRDQPRERHPGGRGEVALSRHRAIN